MDSKPAAKSLTLWSIALAAAPVIAQWAGIDPQLATDGVNAAITLTALCVAAYGRIRAGGLRWPWS